MMLTEIGGNINADRGKICEDIIHTGKYGECDSTAVDDRT